jgi:uncharacterized protein YndB with AHSA1/START domain
MTTPASATVLPFQVPPVIKDVQVACDPLTAFDRFTRDIALWWPVRTHSLSESDATQVAFEPSVGGRLFERTEDGTEHTWGRVSAWEPGVRVAFSWHVGRAPGTAQAIEVSFVARDGGTGVRLVHSGWQHLGERAAAARDEYDNGWETVFMRRYREFADEGPRP